MILKKIKNNIFAPHKILIKIYLLLEKRLLNTIYLLNGENKKTVSSQETLFKKNSLNRDDGLNLFNKILNEYKFLKKPMNSEHQVIFCSIAQLRSKKIKKILEIGTFDGTNAFLLATLFPKAHVTTLDLNDENEIFKTSYNRDTEEKRKVFINKRNNILLKKKNISFVQKNSLSLTRANNTVDLIWIDGSHGYPEVSIDVSNSLRMSHKNSYVLCDDIYIDNIRNDKMYNSNAGYETIVSFSKAGIINFDLFYKRVDSYSNCIPRNRKFVALIKLQ